MPRGAAAAALLSLAATVPVAWRAEAFGEDRIRRLDWEGLPVVHLEDERFPTYTLSVYFAEGAGGDGASFPGETAAMFDLLTAGTRRYDQTDILEHLEFFGVSHGARVTHEYSSYQISGLVKDLVPTVKMICHLFRDATYPSAVVKKELGRSVSALRNMASEHGALATRAFRALSMAGTPYASHVEGTIASLRRIGTGRLKARLARFNDGVAKRIYLSGGKEVLGIRKVLLEECGWKGSRPFPARAPARRDFPKGGPKVHLVTVPGANQAQIRIGRFLAGDEAGSMELNNLVSDFLGGGLTSRLLAELRTRRGLVYSAMAVFGKQRDYGRGLVGTYTRNGKVVETITVLRDMLAGLAAGNVGEREFRAAQGKLIGGHPFRFEGNASLLDQLLFLDHVGKPWSEFFRFRERLGRLNLSDLVRGFRELFDWGRMTVVVVGDPSLAAPLRRLGPLSVTGHGAFL